jgi:hypothetical protein
MSLRKKALLLGIFQCLLVLSLSGKLLYDRETRPRVWVKTRPWDPSLPIRGRYLSLQLVPQAGDPYFDRTNQQGVLFFVPEHTTEVEKMRAASRSLEVWVEVTIPRSGPPRPIRLGTKTEGSEIQPAIIN